MYRSCETKLESGRDADFTECDLDEFKFDVAAIEILIDK
jgi:hypothetical protein